MRVLVNGLSIGSLSGQHVVFGFLQQLLKWTGEEHQFIILHDETQELPETLHHPAVTSLPVSRKLRNWMYRIGWEFTKLPKLIRAEKIDVLLNPSGALAPRIPCPQVVLCQNPWCFVPQVHCGWKEKLKATLQRRGYRNALRRADLMIYISEHLRSLYRAGSGQGPEAPGVVAYVGINDTTFNSAAQLRNSIERDPFLIVSVSAMAAWKGAHTLVPAVIELQSRGIPAKLKLIGPWPDSDYEQSIRDMIHRETAGDFIQITGKVSKEELHRSYAQARVFSLLSECESFGIPAAEAQAFGTPGVITSGCAMPEVCGAGVAVPPNDVLAAADELEAYLVDDAYWEQQSQAALQNVEKLRWEVTTRPFLSLFSLGHQIFEMGPVHQPEQVASNA